MVDQIQDWQTVGFLGEGSNEGTEVITAGITYYHFGVFEQEHEFPELIQEIEEYKKGDSFFSYQFFLTNYHVESAIIAVPSNCIMHYHLFGGAVTVGDVTTITPQDLGNTETVNIRSNSDNGEDYFRETSLGMKLVQIAGSVPLTRKDLPLIETYAFLGEDLIDSVVTTRVDPTYPDGGTRDSQLKYKPNIGSFSITWDGEEIGDKVQNFTYLFNTLNAIVKLANQKKAERVSNDDIYIFYEFDMSRRDVQSLNTDFKAQKTTLTEKTFVFKIYASATRYKQYSSTQCVIGFVKKNRAFLAEGQEPIYRVQIRARNIVITDDSALAGSFYGQ